MAVLTFLHKGHAFSVLVSIYMCTDCQHVEIIRTKTLTGLSDLRLVFFLIILNLFYDLQLQNTFSFFTYCSFISNSLNTVK